MFLLRSLARFSELIVREGEPEMIRLSKWMSMKSICSRRQAEELIQMGLVRVDGMRIKQNMLVPSEASLKAFTPLGLQKQKPITKLWMINKPRGCICTRNDPQKRPTVYELLPKEFEKYGHIMSVGRLDFNSEGLLLLTNDSTLKNLLENPEADLIRYYRVKVHGRVTPQKIQKMNSPLFINDVQYGPLHAVVSRSLSTNTWINISLKTGKNRQIRRIMQKCDLQVSKLVRLEYGHFKLGKLLQRDVEELCISEGLERKIKQVKAKSIAAKIGRPCLIEVDIRKQAIQYARQQLAIEQSHSARPELKGSEKSIQKADNERDDQ